MLDIRFEIGGRRLDPCFIGDSEMKATLLWVARQIRNRFAAVRIPDRQDPLRVLVKGEDIDHLHYELDGPESVLRQVEERFGAIRSERIVLGA